MKMDRKWIVLAALSALLLVSACGKKKDPVIIPPPQTTERAPTTDVAPDTTPAGPVDAREEAPPQSIQELQAEAERSGLLGDVFYDFDQYGLRSEARDRLQKNASYMKQNPDLRFTIEGHCDERGTNEYNIALGQSRSTSALDYLVSLGVASSRFKTISYGEERPFCTESTGACWQRNRRARFVNPAALQPLMVGNWIQRAGVVLLAMSALSCVSSTDLDSIQTQLQDIQLQVLQLQKQSPSKSELADLEAGVNEQIQALLRAQADVRTDVKAISSQIEQLEDKLEDTNFRLAQLSQQIAATNQELQAVRNATEEAGRRAPTPPAVVNPTDPQAVYDTAYNDYLQGNFDLAILGFHQYADTYRSTELADNAIYWIGECYYRQSKFQKAIERFDDVLNRFDRSDRTPSALLKKGYAYFELGQRAQGVVHLQSVIREHAGTDEAHLASQRLQEMGVESPTDEN